MPRFSRSAGPIAWIPLVLVLVSASLAAQIATPPERGASFSDAQLLNREIHVLTPTGHTRLTPQNVESALSSNALIAERVPTRALGNEGEWQLPFQYSTTDGDTYRPKVVIISPVVFKNESNTFEGLLGLGVLSESDATAGGRLPQPVRFTIGGDADSIMPNQLEIGHLNQPFAEISITVREPANKLVLNFFASFDPDPEELEVPARRPELEISIAPSAVDGFGLGLADVNISTHRDYAGRTVTLRNTGGRIGDSILTLGPEGTAQTQIRSQFVGGASVSAGGYPFDEASGSIEFVLPIVLFVAGALGALGGAAVRKVVKHENSGQFFVAVICGFIGAVLAALGVNFVNLPVTIPAGEALAFVLAASGAYLGAGLFSSLPSRSRAST